MKQKYPARKRILFKFKQPFGRLKIGTKFTVILLFITLFAMGVVGALSYRVGRNIIDQQINQVLSIQTNRSLEAINKMVFDRLSEMELLISDSLLSNKEVSLEEKTKLLKSKLISLGWYDQLHLTDASGKIIASTTNAAMNFDFSKEPWYQVTQKEFINVSDVVISPFSGKKVLMFANTVQNENNDILGVLVAEFSLNVIADLLKNTPKDFEAYLLTGEEKVIVYHGPPEKQNLSINNQGDYQYNSNYLQQQVQSQGYFSFKGNGWKLTLQIPTQIAYEPIRDFSWSLFITFLMIAVVVVVYGRFTGKKFVTPILLLTQGVAKMQKGDLKQTVEVESEDEIGYLAKGFNAMTHELDEKTRHLLEEKGKYKSILESSNEAIVLFNTKNKAIAFNQEFHRLFLKRKNQKRVENYVSILNLLDKKNVNEESKRAIEMIQKMIRENNFKKSLSLEVTLKNPFYAILALYTKPVLGEDGSLLGRIWVFNNITQEIEAERSKREFIHVASHKLRTPITTVNWNTQMLLDGSLGKLSADQKGVMEHIEEAADHLTLLSNVLINVAEIENDKIKVDKEMFDLKAMIQSVHASTAKKIKRHKHLAFKMSVPEQELKVKSDEKKMRQVLEALIDNALRYQKEEKEGEIELKVSLDKKSKKIIVAVSDKGVGIPEKEQHKVFSKFFRSQGADLLYPDGMGLSLFLAKIIVDSLGEKIGFESVEGKGSRFWFSLQLA